MILHDLQEILKQENLDMPVNRNKTFGLMAEKLFNQYALFINYKPFRLTEIEFYYHHPEAHPDPFVHRDVLQREMGVWYFHKTGANYRSGTFKGMDITFGNESIPTFGGILIRAVEEIDPPENYIYGPSKCVDMVLRETGESFDKMDGKQVIPESCPLLYLEELSHAYEEVIKCPRVGLPVRPTGHLNNIFRYINYRFLIFPKKKHKGKVSLIAPSLLVQGYSKHNINQLLGYRAFNR